MCTLATKKKLSIAIKPVKCYKILHAFGIYHCTPLQRTSISYKCFSEKRKERETFEAKGETEINKTDAFMQRHFGNEYKYRAEEGFIHCFKNAKDARMAAQEYMYASGYEYTEVWEVEVPFGTKYIEGINAWSGDASHSLDKLSAIAANKIMFKKCVATYY